MPALRQASKSVVSGSKGSKKRTERQTMKSDAEKARRDRETELMKGISRFFKMGEKPWSKKDTLALGEIILRIDKRY
jgi:hypothetical protein